MYIPTDIMHANLDRGVQAYFMDEETTVLRMGVIRLFLQKGDIPKLVSILEWAEENKEQGRGRTLDYPQKEA